MRAKLPCGCWIAGERIDAVAFLCDQGHTQGEVVAASATTDDCLQSSPKSASDSPELVSLRARVAAAERDRDVAVQALPVEGWAEFMAERDAIAVEQDRYGLPREVGVSGLLRHIYNNRDAAFGALNLAIDGWKARAERAEARVATLEAALRRCQTKYGLAVSYIPAAKYQQFRERAAALVLVEEPRP